MERIKTKVSRFNGLVPLKKALKRLSPPDIPATGLKPSANVMPDEYPLERELELATHCQLACNLIGWLLVGGGGVLLT